MNIQLIAEQIGHIHLTLETSEAFEVYGGTALAPFEVSQTGTAQWTLTVREKTVVAAPLRQYNVYARQLATGREWEVLSGKILVSARTAAVPADKLAPVEYFVTVPVVDHDVDAVGSTIVQGIPGPQGPKGDKGDPGEGGMSDEERALLNGAAQRDSANTFTAANTFTGEVDMSGASVTPPSGWNVGELTAEEVQAVVPIQWRNFRTALGESVKAGGDSTVLGSSADGMVGTCVVVGKQAKSAKNRSVTIGVSYYEAIDGQIVWSYCTTEGTGSITIGAGANTLNNGDTESSNSVTIGCKASNSGADSVVIGAQAKTSNWNSVTVGAGAVGSSFGVAIGRGATTEQWSVVIGVNGESKNFFAVGVGAGSKTKGHSSIAIGYNAQALQHQSCAIGRDVVCNDAGTIVLGVKNEDTSSAIKTRVYIAGANTPLANEYEDGEAMMGYVVADSSGNPLAAGTQKLSVLFPNNSGFQPMALSLDDEMTPPKVFHPSDLDMPTEEPSEVEEYTPLPVYPIVEPDEDELRTPTGED